jgi:ATP-dependent protease ClpP protease subunit
MPIKIMAKADKRAEMTIYGPIGQGFFEEGATAEKVRKDLEALGDVSDIDVFVNSPGGNVWEGLAIANVLSKHPAQVHAHVDGLAASAASVITSAADMVTMGKGAMMMIHSPWSLTAGNAEDLRNMADVLDKIESGFLDIYEQRTGKPRNELLDMLKAETWFTAQEAVDEGFADDLVESKPREKVASASWQPVMACFKKTPQGFTPPQAPAAQPQSAPAGAATKETKMPENTTASVQTTDNAAVQAAAETATANERKRVSDITAKCGQFAMDAAFTQDAISKGLTVEQVNAQILNVKYESTQGGHFGHEVKVTADEQEKFNAGATQSLMARSGLEKRESGNEFNGMSLSGLAGLALIRAGISVRGMSADAIARKVLAQHTSSDFPNLLSNVAGKVLRNAYDSFPNTWQSWCLVGAVSDFKIHPRIQIGSFNNLDTIPEGGEYKYGSLTEEYENAQAATKGKAIALSRQMIVNDDLGGFNRRAQLMGRAAARSVNHDVYTLLTSGSSNHGPTSQDTGQYFNATASTTAGGHQNLTDSGTAISTASIALGRKTMRIQKDAGNREVLNILPKFLVCSALKEDIAWAVLNSTSEISSSNANKKNYAYDVAKLSLVTDPFLDGIGSGLPWYMFADPMDVAAFEVVFLDGNQAPFLDEAVDFDTDSMKFKVRLDYGVALGDWRAGYLNDGA